MPPGSVGTVTSAPASAWAFPALRRRAFPYSSALGEPGPLGQGDPAADAETLGRRFFDQFDFPFTQRASAGTLRFGEGEGDFEGNEPFIMSQG